MSFAVPTQVHTFAQPIDAVSFGLPQKDAVITVWTGSEWQTLEVEDESDPILMESNLLTFDTPVHQVIVRGAHQYDVHPIRVSKAPASYEIAATGTVEKPFILTRNQWGANDEYLFAGPVVTRSDEPVNAEPTSTEIPQRVQDCNTAQVNYPQDFATTRTVTHAPNGERYRWAQRYSPNVKLLVVHHTAQKVTGDSRPAIERVRALYEFHANSRGWGDIGYHYLVDESGQIYEGRSGGDKVVGGHVYCNNVGSIGVALLGNFDLEQPTQAQVIATQKLLQYLADKYDINLSRNAVYHGKNTKPIVRHKDLISTECPGYYMSNVITQVRQNVAAGRVDNGVTFPTIAKTTTTRVVDNTAQRLQQRLAEAGESLSRSYYRARRLTRTAERLNTSNRMDYLRTTRQTADNTQRLRSARTVQPGRPTRGLVTASPTASEGTLSTTPDDAIRIRLSYQGANAEITFNGAADVNGTSTTETVRLGLDGHQCVAVAGGRVLAQGTIRITPSANMFEVSSWNTRNNVFRGTVECRIIDAELVLINEVDLDDYMKGLAEQPDTEPYEKQRAFAIAARSYAAHYMGDAYRKFPGKPYDGDDSPARFQKYAGVMFERNQPNWVRAVSSTADRVLMKDGGIVKAAYYSSNDGRTRSPADNGWRNFPHEEVFFSKPDPWCEGMELRGHGVGMSGCGAEGQANDGKSAEEILRYYYPNTEITLLP